MEKRSYVLIFSFVISSLVLILLSLFNGIGFIVDGFDFVVKPFSTSLRSSNIELSNFFSKYLNGSNLQDQNFNLHKEIIGLKEQLNDYNELQKENEFLKTSAKIAGPISSDLVMAAVVSTNSGGTMLIDKGKVNNVQEGDIVLVSKGTVLGRVRNVNQFTSLIETVGFTKSGSKGVSVLAVESGKDVKGFLLEENGKLIVSDILKTNPLSANAVFMTTGDDRIYPRGLVIGSVDKINEKATESVKTANLKMDYDINQLKYVYILKFKP